MTVRLTRALTKRDLRRFFNNPTAYVFVTLFIFLSAAAAFWRPRFFVNNLATLDQLNEVFPYLLLFFVPALTMGVWAEERKQGTDELLLTLPGTDTAIVLGKYLAVLCVYTVSVLLSLSHAAILWWLGSPDPGLMASNYVGYWVAGAALVAVGMFGSLLTAHATVAFVLAALFCAVPVLVDAAAATFSSELGRRLVPFGLFSPFDDFARGSVSLTGFLYFASLAALFLYLNVVVIGRRHWGGSPDAAHEIAAGDDAPRSGRRLWRGVVRRAEHLPMAIHHGVRVMSIAIALVALNHLAARADLRLDATAERLHSMGAETRRLIAGLAADRPVSIQAFVSPEVPEEYVQQQRDLLDTIHEIQAIAGPRVEVAIHETEPYSEAARTARERFGIVPRLVADANSVRGDPQNVFLGFAVTSGSEEQVVPFMEHGLSAEYEVSRAIRAVARATRKRLGIVDTDAKVFGGLDYESGRNRLPWAIMTELRRQYDTVQITPWEQIDENLDALLVVMPSTLLQREMDNVFAAIKRGVPALILVDPIPAMDMRLAPAAAMAARLNPYARPGEAAVRKNTGDIQKAMSGIGVLWPPARAARDGYRPRADLAHLPREVVFIGPGSGNAEAFNPKHAATSGLEEAVFMYAGYLTPADHRAFRFEPLIGTGRLAATASYFQLVQPTPAGPTLNVNLPHQPEGQILTLAAHVRSSSPEAGAVNVIVIADLDFISDQFFAMRASADVTARFDNVALFLNCIDVLAGDESFIALRNRRVRYRTLGRVEAATRTFIERRSREEQEAAEEAEKALENARAGLKRTIAAIDERAELDAQARQIMARNVEELENRKLEALRVKIEQARDAKIQASRETMEAEMRRIQGTIRTTAVALPPVPVVALGIAFWIRRRRRERAGAAAAGRLRREG